MSTEIGTVHDNRATDHSIGVATGYTGIRLFSTVKKIWLSVDGARELIDFLQDAIQREGGNKDN